MKGRVCRRGRIEEYVHVLWAAESEDVVVGGGLDIVALVGEGVQEKHGEGVEGGLVSGSFGRHCSVESDEDVDRY